MMALTATATAKERAWIMENLRFSTNPAYVEEVVKSLRRKNVLIRCHFDSSLNGKDWEKKKAKDVLDSVKDGHVVVVFVRPRPGLFFSPPSMLPTLIQAHKPPAL
jgi:superfamily II DNA helicase RecQ